MLDNLKLGYGGNKDEMIRLINDSKILDEEISSLDNITFDQMIEAIHVVQTEIGITGTTALEAAGTIEGSVGSMKAAWQNLLVELAKDDGNVSSLMDYFVASFETAANNMIPRITTVLSSMGDLVAEIAPIIAEKLPGVIKAVLPSLLQTSAALMSGLVSGLAQAAPAFMDAAVSLMAEFTRTLRNGDSGGESIIANLISEATKRLPALIHFSKRIISELAEGVVRNAGDIGDAIGELISYSRNWVLRNSQKIVDIGVDIAETLVNGFLSLDFEQAASDLSYAIKTVLGGIDRFIEEIDWEQVGITISDFLNSIDWSGILTSLSTVIGDIVKNTPELLKGILANLDIDNAFDAAGLLAAKTMITSIYKYLGTNGDIKEKFSKIRTLLNSELTLKSVDGGISFGRSFVIGIQSFLIGWDIGSWIYSLWQPQIDAVVWQLFDDFADFGEAIAKTAKAAFSKDYSMEDARREYLEKLESRRASSSNEVYNKWLDEAIEAQRATVEYDEYLSTQRNARGGIFTHPTYDRFGNLYGEAGREALLPLDNNTGWMDELAARLGGNNGVTVQNLYLSVEGGRMADDYDTDRFIERVSEKLAALSVRQDRAVGGTGWQ